MSESPLVLPVIAEALEVHASPVETGRVRIRKMVHAREETVDPPLLRDEVVIERVPIHRVVEASLSARSEEDTLVVPLFEEVRVVEKRLLLRVVEKRLLLKEEVHITTRRIETHTPQSATLRREEATVERINPEGDDNNPST